MSSTVYFSRTITPEKVLELYQLLGKNLEGKVAVKVHSGEKGNQNFLKPDFWKPMIDHVDGTVVECNTAYRGERNTTEKHLKLISYHGWDKYFEVDILDAEGPDLCLDMPDGKVIKKNYVGKNIEKYDSMLVLSHFKGHPMGGYGGAIKQLSIGVASSFGKAYIHGAGVAGVIVRFTTDEAVANNDEFAAVAKNIALQIAAGSPPTYVCQAEVPANVIEEEKNIQVAALKNDPKNANKPDAILEKIVIGKMGKFYESVCLLDQSFFKEDDMSVGKYLETEGKRLGGKINVVDFVLYEKGEGLEKREDNFAEEIAKLTGNN